MKEYGELLGHRRGARRSQPGSATYPSCWPRSSRERHAALCRCASPTTTPATCSTRRACAPQPRELLRAIPELELLEVATEPEICCGSAGIYNLVQPRAAAELGARKARHLLDTGAEAIAAGNPGCAAQLDLHLRELGHPLPIHHPVELVWRSIEAGSRH